MNKLGLLLIIVGFLSCNSGNKKVEKADVGIEKEALAEATINIGGLHCEMCVASVTKGVNELEGVANVKVTLSDSVAVVSYNSKKLELAEIEKAIEKRGYTIKEIGSD